MAECFWTDLLGVSEVCGDEPGEAQTVDVVLRLFYGTEPLPLQHWEWAGDVLFDPPTPPPPAAPHWQPFYAPGTTIVRIRNTIVPGGVELPFSDFVLDPATGAVGFNGTVELPGLSTSGGQGPYRASGFYMEVSDATNAGLDQQYNALPSAYQYPPGTENYAWLPPRRGVGSVRLVIDMHFEYGLAVEGSVTMYPGYAGVAERNGTPPPETFNLTTEPYTDYMSTATHMGPPGVWRNEWDLPQEAAAVSLALSPANNTSVTAQGSFIAQYGVMEPPPIAAYVDDLEWFEGVELLIPNNWAFPAAGTGQEFPGWRLPVFYNDEYWEGPTWMFQAVDNSNYGFTRPEAADLIFAALAGAVGALVGTLRASGTDQPICRVAVAIGHSEGGV